MTTPLPGSGYLRDLTGAYTVDSDPEGRFLLVSCTAHGCDAGILDDAGAVLLPSSRVLTWSQDGTSELGARVFNVSADWRTGSPSSPAMAVRRLWSPSSPTTR